MLKDRRVLLEQEIKKAHDLAAAEYFNIVTANGDTHSVEYQAMKQHITNLQFDLSVVNNLINKGYE